MFNLSCSPPKNMDAGWPAFPLRGHLPQGKALNWPSLWPNRVLSHMLAGQLACPPGCCLPPHKATGSQPMWTATPLDHPTAALVLPVIQFLSAQWLSHGEPTCFNSHLVAISVTPSEEWGDQCFASRSPPLTATAPRSGPLVPAPTCQHTVAQAQIVPACFPSLNLTLSCPPQSWEL